MSLARVPLTSLEERLVRGLIILCRDTLVLSMNRVFPVNVERTQRRIHFRRVVGRTFNFSECNMIQCKVLLRRMNSDSIDFGEIRVRAR
jgi:hypothetical protein